MIQATSTSAVTATIAATAATATATATDTIATFATYARRRTACVFSPPLDADAREERASCNWSTKDVRCGEGERGRRAMSWRVASTFAIVGFGDDARAGDEARGCSAGRPASRVDGAGESGGRAPRGRPSAAAGAASPFCLTASS